LPVLLVALALAGGLTFMLSSQVERADRTVDVHEREGTVLGIKQGGSRGASIVRVHLDDGRDVDAYSTSRVVVPKGSHVIVTEARHASGRRTYDVVRLVDQ
jgi:hypothetical protein